MSDSQEGRQLPGARLESFRDLKTRAIRIRGADFSVVVQESGAVTVHYSDRVVRLAPGGAVIVEPAA